MILIEHHVMVKVNNISRFFRDKIEIFSNLVVRDEIKICFFYISCFETRSRICFTTSRISRRGRETKQLILEVEREFSMLILARHFEIENSRQCLHCPHFHTGSQPASEYHKATSLSDPDGGFLNNIKKTSNGIITTPMHNVYFVQYIFPRNRTSSDLS